MSERRAARWALAALLLAALVPLLWPGDVPFIHDEPQLMAKAVAANAEGRLAPLGLLGTFGVTYGPLPVWMYQALLWVTHDLVPVALAHAALMAFVSAGALWSLARTLGLWPGFAAVPLLTPYFWFYARVMWDNTLLLPLATLAYAGYAAFLARDSVRGLGLAAACVFAVPLVHLMGLSLVTPLVLHALVARGRALRAHAAGLVALGAAVGWLAWPYWSSLAAPRAETPAAASTWLGWIFPLQGARLLGSGGLDYFVGAETVGGLVFAAADVIALAPYLLVWSGIGVAVSAVARAVRAGAWDARAHLAALALAALVMQAVVHGVSGKFEHPHYQNGTWIATVLLAWMAVDALARRTGGPAMAAATTLLVLATNATAVATLVVRLHEGRGTRNAVYGPVLAEQQEVARLLAPLAPDSPLDMRVDLWIRFPGTLATLRSLQPAPAGERPRAQIVVDYATRDPRRADVRVIVR